MEPVSIGSMSGSGKDTYSDHLKKASETVKSWPQWKQGVLGKSSFSVKSSETSKKEK